MNLLGAIFGLGLGVGLATLLEYRDTSLRVEEEIVRFLALPVVATIPVMRTPLDQRVRRRILWSCAAAIVALAFSGAAFFWKMGAFE